MKILMASGWKSVTAAVCTMLLGVSALVLHFVAPDSAWAMTPEVALPVIIGGFYALGMARKIERIAGGNKD